MTKEQLQAELQETQKESELYLGILKAQNLFTQAAFNFQLYYTDEYLLRLNEVATELQIAHVEYDAYIIAKSKK